MERLAADVDEAPPARRFWAGSCSIVAPKHTICFVPASEEGRRELWFACVRGLRDNPYSAGCCLPRMVISSDRTTLFFYYPSQGPEDLHQVDELTAEDCRFFTDSTVFSTIKASSAAEVEEISTSGIRIRSFDPRVKRAVPLSAEWTRRNTVMNGVCNGLLFSFEPGVLEKGAFLECVTVHACAWQKHRVFSSCSNTFLLLALRNGQPGLLRVFLRFACHVCCAARSSRARERAARNGTRNFCARVCTCCCRAAQGVRKRARHYAARPVASL